MFKYLKEDIRVIYERDPAANNILEILLTYSGLHAITIHRFSHRLYVWLKNIAPFYFSRARFLTGIEIHPRQK